MKDDLGKQEGLRETIEASLIERYRTESEFMDRAVSLKYAPDGNYELTNRRNYQELFSLITQFRKIVQFFGDITGKTILDAACGVGWVSLYFARSGGIVHCFDISKKSIELAKRFAASNGLASGIHAEVMVAEDLRYRDEFFDFIFMNAALHHCDIERVSLEFHRVLKPGGKAALIEDYGYHPLLNIYRYFTPTKHTPFEKALKVEDVRRFLKPFSHSETEYYQLLDIWDKQWALKPILSHLDEIILKNFPMLRKYTRLVGIYVVK